MGRKQKKNESEVVTLTESCFENSSLGYMYKDVSSNCGGYRYDAGLDYLLQRY